MTKTKARWYLSGIVTMMLTLVLIFVGNVQAEAADTTYNVTNYGANGTDTTSDRAAIQQALNIAKTTDKSITVYVPDGTYYLDGMLFIYSDTTLELSENAIIKRANGYSGIMLVNNADDNSTDKGGYTRSSNITVTGGTWNGEIASPTSYDNLLYFGHAENITIKDTTIKNCYGAHLIELTGVKASKVINVNLSGFTGSGNTTEDNAKEAIQLDRVTETGSEFYTPYDNTACEEIVITGCKISNYPCGVGSHTEGENMSYITIEGNTFTDISNMVVQTINYANFDVSNNVQVINSATAKFFVCSSNSSGSIKGNTIVGTGDNAVYIANGSTVTVEGNDIKNAALSGVRVTGSTATVTDNTITGCKSCGIYADAASTITANSNTIKKCLVAAMSAANCTSVEYTGNRISKCTENGISINCGTSKTSIKNNKINVSGNFGIVIFGATESVIEGNTVSGISEYGIYLRESLADVYSSNVTIKNNTVTGGDQAFAVRKSNGTTVTGNTASGSSVGSIYVANTSSKTVVKNNNFADALNVYDSTATVEYNNGKVTKEVKQASDGNWYYYENGVINYSYTGLASNSSGWWYIKNGKVDFTYTGLCQYDGKWYYIEKGHLTWGKTGLCKYNGDWWYYKNSTVDFSYTGLYQYNGTWYYIGSGKLNWNYTGLCKYGSSWYYVEKGVLTWGKTGLCQYNGTWYYYSNSTVNFKYTGLCKHGSNWYYVEKGVLTWGRTGLCLYNGDWWYYKNSTVDFSYTGLYQYNGTWYYIGSGKLNWNYTGLCKYGNNWYYVEKGVLTWGKTGLCLYNGDWWYYKNSTVDFSYTGLYQYNGTWYYIGSGKLNWNYTGLCKYGNNWYYVEKGVLTWGKTGLCQYNGTWYYYSNSTVNFSYTGYVKYDGKTYYVKNGVLA